MQASLRKVLRCRICGFTEIETDEVFHREFVLLAECPRCEHRWTSSGPPPLEPTRVRASRVSRPEVASAA